MQATCDADRKFLDVEIRHPGATSDFLAFQTSDLNNKLQSPNFLHPELAIYGDCAYVNSSYMATPYKGVSGGNKDAYNFFHSQVRINIECAFGMLCHRFGILRKSIPPNISTAKTTALVMCLCRLQNYCIDHNDINVPTARHSDMLAISLEGGISNPDSEAAINSNAEYRPVELLDGGNHQNDYNRYQYRQYRVNNETISPREKMLAMVIDKDLKRPLPAKWRH
jgi:DDE superfamily endonuclease